METQTTTLVRIQDGLIRLPSPWAREFDGKEAVIGRIGDLLMVAPAETEGGVLKEFSAQRAQAWARHSDEIGSALMRLEREPEEKLPPLLQMKSNRK